MSDDNVRIDTRLSGQIRRYHTWPTTGTQTIAEHSWNLIRIYFSVEENPNIHMIYHLQFHDIGETTIGDLPYPIKRDNPNIKRELDWLEAKSYVNQLGYWDSFRQVALSDSEKILFKHLHLVEMFEFGLDQTLVGNCHGFIIADRCIKAIYEEMPCARLCEYVIKRIKLWRAQTQDNTFYNTNNSWWVIPSWENKRDESERNASRRDTLQDAV